MKGAIGKTLFPATGFGHSSTRGVASVGNNDSPSSHGGVLLESQFYLHHLRHDKMPDRETLLEMGFDSARVDCECIYPPLPRCARMPRFPSSLWAVNLRDTQLRYLT